MNYDQIEKETHANEERISQICRRPTTDHGLDGLLSTVADHKFEQLGSYVGRAQEQIGAVCLEATKHEEATAKKMRKLWRVVGFGLLCQCIFNVVLIALVF